MAKYRIFFLLTFLIFIHNSKESDDIFASPRYRRQDDKDVTTVLLLDNQGRSSFGRFLNVKPDLGLITSTARTFIQEGVTTEYATQVLGTTLDNGRLYAHLLTKSSRVLYDDDRPSSSSSTPKSFNKVVNFDNLIRGDSKNYIKNTDFISPNRVDPPASLVFPTQLSDGNKFTETEEILNESPSNNFPYNKNNFVLPLQNNNNVKVFKINPQVRDLTHENIINHKENEQQQVNNESVSPSKVKEINNLPTFTVRNEFSPSGFSFLGDLPDFNENTQQTSKPATASERKAKLLFRAGLAKPNPKDFTSITYTGFADFTTTVGDTIIVFTPHTTTTQQQINQATKAKTDPSIVPTRPVDELTVASTVKTFLSYDPGMETKTVEGHKLEMKTSLPTMVIDKTDRRTSKQSQVNDKPEDLAAKSRVLAHEQSGEETDLPSSTILFSPEAIQPSESQTPMFSTPSDEDIAKIFASLQAQAKQSTQPLPQASKVEEVKKDTQVFGGATTIFFDDEEDIKTSAVQDVFAQASSNEVTTNSANTEVTTENILTTNEVTTNKLDSTTTESTTTTTENAETTPREIAKEEDSEEKSLCTETTTQYKTLTYLTTFFIPVETSTSTSIKSNKVVTTEIGYQTKSCIDNEVTIKPSTVAEITTEPSIATTTENKPESTTTEEIDESTTSSEESLTTTTTKEEKEPTTTENLFTTTENIQEITTERRHVTESEPETTDITTESGEEIELIYKTLYTTYTYLTTFFKESTSSVESRIVVTTNVITSTLDPAGTTDPAVAGLFEREDSLVSAYKSKSVTFEDFADISPSNVDQIVRPTEKPEGNFAGTPRLINKDLLESTTNAIKTYYTTYTYFTTIFVDGETEISSRTEVYTNYVTPSEVLNEIKPTKALPKETFTKLPNDIDDELNDDDIIIRNKIKLLNATPSLNIYNSTIKRQKTASVVEDDKVNDVLEKTTTTPRNKEYDYVTLQRAAGGSAEESDNNILNLSDYETISTMVTDVRSSTSKGDRRIIDNVEKRNVLDDQIVSESNNDSEILPSPTLLLQTSYTTFTYFTTMYQGTQSNVVSRLETITNVVTQTLTPTHTLSVEDLSLPVTYFTTFTYWTTLYKDGTTKVTSREETVSNIVTPSLDSLSTISITPTVTTSTIEPTKNTEEAVVPSTVGEDDLTTYFTTYTYYTTSYVGDKTVLNSRLETVTNVLNNTAIDNNQIGRAVGTANSNSITEEATTKSDLSSSIKPTGLLSTIVNTVETSGVTTILSTDVYGTYIDGLYAKVLESTSSILTETPVSSSSVSTTTENLKPTGVVSINKGKIVDAEGISTLFYTTQAIGTYIDNLYAQVIDSTSTLTVDEAKKAQQSTDVPVAHKTGLVRSIEGSIVQNDTTTFYESKVLGTVIDGRYAQIIESTSSFLANSASIKPSGANSISPSTTQGPDIQLKTISPSPAVVESSISDASTKADDDEDSSEEDDDESNNGRQKSRLTFQSRKRTFTPAIRPFASRQRPTFAPKRKTSGVSTATTVTRSDFTPTVTAVPASKPGRFGGRRTSSSNNLVQPTPSGTRRFSRTKSSSNTGLNSSSFGGGRRGSSRIQPTATGFGSSTRRGGFRSSSSSLGARASNSLFGGNSRFRIRPTASSSLNRNQNTATADEENNLTTSVTDNPTDGGVDDQDTTLPLTTTTESSSRRSQNPLLRFRRPPLARPTHSSRGSSTRNSSRTTASRASTTTSAPKTTTRLSYTRQNSLLNRPRPNALFPRRGLFTTTTPPPEEDEEEEPLDEEGESGEDTDYDGSQTQTQTARVPTSSTKPETRGGRGQNNVQIKPFVGFRRRSKRETNYSRFRRPTGRTTTTTAASEEVETTTRSRFSNKFRSKIATSTQPPQTTPRKRIISPSKASNQQRSQFTLREKDSNARTSSFKRPTSSSRSRPTSSSRTRSRNNYQNDSNARKSSNRQQTTRTNSRRGSTRQRYNQDVDNNFILPQFDGTITVTHQIPTEVTIPVVNGKITEYKNIVTAKYSTQVLDPKQYATSVNPFGKEVTVLLSDQTEIANNGATLITQFVLNETPTTSVTFTPTYIRGRKTSFSHVIPSTVYLVESVVNTIQPALAAQAPLANILLSQLLLGGLQPQNPLLALQNPGIGATPTPTTEFKTRTTTYVTTVTSQTSTVLPITFRGKEILTTIIDSSVTVVTATEFLTDTVVVTPTLAFPNPAVNPQLNTLLLPLLQQQLQQQNQPQNLLNQNLQPADVVRLPQSQELYQEPEKFNLAIDDESAIVEEEKAPVEPPRRKSGRKKNKKPAVVEPTKETSVITLYVSGRHPGEFSTVLSTITVGEESKKRKREAPYVKVSPSRTVDEDLIVSTLDYFDTYVSPAMKEVELESSVSTAKETESLESILGDVAKHVTQTKPIKHSKKYQINLTDLNEPVPLIMPKVETSKLINRGNNLIKTNTNYVSNEIGNKNSVFNKLNNIRYKRDLSSIKNESVDILRHSASNNKRVVKKLIRIEPIYNNNKKDSEENSITSTESGGTHKRKKPRRKLIIKKKKKLPPPTTTRRKVVKTKKRLLSPTKINFIEQQTTKFDLESSFDEQIEEETVTPQNVPDYEPFFPELSESIDAPILILKTTVLSTINTQIKTIVDSRLRTYTFLVTRVNGDETLVTSSTEVKPKIKTNIVTESFTQFTTLTLLDLDATSPIPSTITTTFIPTLENNPQINYPDNNFDSDNIGYEEARYNLATRIMSNGVEVIVAGDKSTYPGKPDLRILSTNNQRITLKPSTLSHHMMMMLPKEDASNIKSLSSLYPNQFVTKTCLTTFTYLTTYLVGGATSISSHEQVVSNVATEERNTGKILPTPAMGITLTQLPNLSVGVFHTTYTYLNTILDGEQPLVVSSEHTVTNTVTAPSDYLHLLKPSEQPTVLKDTNTYYSTINLEKTIYEGDKSSVISTNEVVTQVVITESVPPKGTSVMTSYIALDIEDPESMLLSDLSTTDVVKTYFVTYTYYNTLVENDKTIVNTNVSTSSDVVTEKIYLHPRKTREHFQILATKSYFTTFTYYTTISQEDNTKTPTVISSHTKVVENVVTETINPNLLDRKYYSSLKSEIKDATEKIINVATLNNGQKIEITVIPDEIKETIKPSSVTLPIEITKIPETSLNPSSSSLESSGNVITGSTIVFVDDDPFAVHQTPSLIKTKIDKETVVQTKKTLKTKNSSLNVSKTTVVSSATKVNGNKKKNANKKSDLSTSASETEETILNKNKKNNSLRNKPSSSNEVKHSTPDTPIEASTKSTVKNNKVKKTNLRRPTNTSSDVSDLLGLGSINIQALKPVLSAMAGLIKTNLKSNRRNDNHTLIEAKHRQTTTTTNPPQTIKFKANSVAASENRPVYIPVADLGDDFEIAESQNIATFHIQETLPNKEALIGKPPTHEASLLNGGSIPISPGELINANSDVIVGKPGRIGPRIPTIPLNQVKVDDTAIIGMKPPPFQTNNIKNNKLTTNNGRKNPVSIKEYNFIPQIPTNDKYVPLSLPNDQSVGNTENNYQIAQAPAHMKDKNQFVLFNSDKSPLLATNIVLPEVVERSTDQPLLVNIQPSQVAFVNIPYNRTTALIFGGQTEPHKNGQYFDDPSPYPEPEFSGIDSFRPNGEPHFASVYNQADDNYSPSKQVNGVIKVGVNVDDGANKVNVINPTKTKNQNINIKVPPISFGMIQQGDEFNAHIISHHLTEFKPPPIHYDIKPTNNNVRNEEIVDLKPPTTKPNTIKHNKFNTKKNNNNVRFPQHNLVEFMRPPPRTPIRFDAPKPVHQQHKEIPIYLVDNADDNKDDDLINEDGEVIQESNSRPLRPGQVPPEILMLEQKRKNQTSVSVRPILSYPKPFQTNVYNRIRNPIVRPENQQTNQIINVDGQSSSTFLPHPVRKPIEKDNFVPNRGNYYTTSARTPTSGNFIKNLLQFEIKNNTRPVTSSYFRKEKIPISTENYINTVQMKYTPFSSSTTENIYRNRPKVTSLPIDSPTVKPYVFTNNVVTNSQTEHPFKANVYTTHGTTKSPIRTSTKPVLDLNLGEVKIGDNSTTISDMELLKPPPIRQTTPYKIIPSNDQHSQSTVNDDVVGLSPPPPRSTTKNRHTSRPFTFPTTTSSTTEFVKYTRITGRPFRRRPEYHRTTSTTSTTVRTTTEEVKTPPVDVIIGSESFVEKTINETLSKMKKNMTIKPEITTVQSSTTIEPSLTTPEQEQETRQEQEITVEVKNTTSSEIATKPSMKDSKTVIPTRFITYTKTSTITITKTTVVKTLGGPPSTLTLLVTKTEKSKVVDTVTQFHTLVKPTSIIETVTTTIEKEVPNSLYPPEVYGSQYPSIRVQPTSVHTPILTTIVHEVNNEPDYDDFIISETDPPVITNNQSEEDDNNSIFVVMTDENHGKIIKIPNNNNETQQRDEMLSTNEVNNVLLGGIFIDRAPAVENPTSSIIPTTKCEPECKAARNELCQRVDGHMKCVCRPGFARMFPDRPCIPTYTYSLAINLNRYGKEQLKYDEKLSNNNSMEHFRLRSAIHEALDRMVMQSDLRDVYHGVHVNTFEPAKKSQGLVNKFYLQLSDNIDESRLEDIFRKYLRNNNYSLGGTEVFADHQHLDELKAQDFDECLHPKFHDCSENAQCFNLKGTYTCSCREGFTDLSENLLYPGRLCSAEQIGCEKCNYHGTCYSRGDDKVFCECFQWYTGEECHINLKVLLIALVTLGTILFALLLGCIIFTCARQKPKKKYANNFASGVSFLPQRAVNRQQQASDSRAMIQDTSSEDSRSETNTLPYVKSRQNKSNKKEIQKRQSTVASLDKTIKTNTNTRKIETFNDQKDRSLTVMIPRAKYHPVVQPNPNNLINYTSFEARRSSVPSVCNETKLLSYLDAGPIPSKSNETRRRYSNAVDSTESYAGQKEGSVRKMSGALISAGFEVSATVVNNMGTLATTTCGTEADRSENATLIHKISADLLSSSTADTRSQFNTLRKSLIDNDLDPLNNWLDVTPRINTISEARSYDETTVPLPMKSFRTDCDSKPSSQHQNEEAHTTAERDLGSTFLLPHTHLYKPDRGSDISGFESL